MGLGIRRFEVRVDAIGQITHAFTVCTEGQHVEDDRANLVNPAIRIRRSQQPYPPQSGRRGPKQRVNAAQQAGFTIDIPAPFTKDIAHDPILVHHQHQAIMATMVKHVDRCRLIRWRRRVQSGRTGGQQHCGEQHWQAPE